MRHLFLLHLLTALVLVAWASPVPAHIYPRPDSTDGDVATRHLPLERDLARREVSDHTDDPVPDVYDLAPYISAFDMASHLTMFGKPAKGTNVLSDAALRRANFPKSLSFEPGTFTTLVDEDLFKVRNVDKFNRALGLLQSAAYAKKLALGRYISGEVDLTQVRTD
jgi:hypothetical protein